MANFIQYADEYPTNLPKRAVNGGWFTGEPFSDNAPYKNIEVLPDAGYMIHYNLTSANPPPDAIFQYPGGIRPGNNSQTMPGISVNPKYGLLANSAPCVHKHVDCACSKCRFSKYAYLE